jgi:isopentenyldiphosphate isomerase
VPIKTGHFRHGGTVYKNILLFIAKPLNYELKPQEEEVERLKWVQINEAGKYLTDYDYYYDAWRELLKRLRNSIL